MDLMTERANNEAGAHGSRLSRLRGLLKRVGLGKLVGYALLAVFAYQVWDRMKLGIGTSYSTLFAIGLVGGGLVLLSGDRTQVETDLATSQERRPRSPLFLLTISGLLLVVGAALGLGALGNAELGVGQLTSLALLVVGLGLLVGAFLGRARLLMPLGVLLVPAVLVTSFIPFPPRGHIGSRVLRANGPVQLDEIEGSHRMLLGDLNIDLVDVVPKDFGDREIDVEVSAGNFSLYVPFGINLEVMGTVEAGNVTIGRGRETGTHLSFHESFQGTRDAGALTVRVRGGVASVYVERISYRERYGNTRQQEERLARRLAERRAERRAEQRRAERRRAERRAEQRADA
ncbi:MAG: hypothetical protein JJE05_00920 [Actinobacteria bacterium]|nr:hypothetical protein [Actinomycetota bacterium]